MYCVHVRVSLSMQPFSSLKAVNSQVGKNEGKVPPECLFGRTGHHIFHAPGDKFWRYMPLSSAHFQLDIFCVAQLVPTPDEMYPLKLKDVCLFFVPSIIHNLTRAAYSPNGFHKLSRPGLKPATPDGRASTLTTQQIRLAL